MIILLSLKRTLSYLANRGGSRSMQYLILHVLYSFVTLFNFTVIFLLIWAVSARKRLHERLPLSIKYMNRQGTR